jgi:LysM repeat protein
MSEQTQSNARLLAPIALVVCAIAFFAIVLSTGGGDDGSDRAPAAKKQTTRKVRTTPTTVVRKNYTVKTGDTLDEIAEKTGVTVDKIEELNPQLDPQALVTGQKIKLRE